MDFRSRVYVFLAVLLSLGKPDSALAMDWGSRPVLARVRVVIADSIRTPQQEEKGTKANQRPDKHASKKNTEIKKEIPKIVPKARNQQIPRPVALPKVKGTGPPIKVKTKINTKLKIKL
ncbi:hypothetical protein [Sphingobacterium luzhongxinii]|uniref:hypothetical protein n=1 Tax=Sphingobacterium luzhongxinii TaxID=2654181 RepID=UPI0013DAA87A|nr:hypothetical protein [Sphingobacterium sp. xlx-73]